MVLWEKYFYFTFFFNPEKRLICYFVCFLSKLNTFLKCIWIGGPLYAGNWKLRDARTTSVVGSVLWVSAYRLGVPLPPLTESVSANELAPFPLDLKYFLWIFIQARASSRQKKGAREGAKGRWEGGGRGMREESCKIAFIYGLQRVKEKFYLLPHKPSALWRQVELNFFLIPLLYDANTDSKKIKLHLTDIELWIHRVYGYRSCSQFGKAAKA